MGARKAPTPVPPGAVKPAPPPPPPAMKVRRTFVAECSVYTTHPMPCPLCQEIVPARTEHRCSKEDS